MYAAQLRLANRARDLLWNPDRTVTVAWRVNELTGEIGEACNLLKKLHREALGLPGSRASLDDLANELADVVICLDLLGMHTDTVPLGTYTPNAHSGINAKDPSEMGCTLAVAVSGFALIGAGIVDDEEVSGVYVSDEVQSCGEFTLAAASYIADFYGIDLPRAVEEKFNATSAKHGFDVRLSDLTDSIPE